MLYIVRWWRQCGWRLRAAASVAATLAALVALMSTSVTVSAHSAASLPRVNAEPLAHLLADFTHHSTLYPYVGEWWIEEESRNVSWWRYTVSFRCGARCEGRAVVAAGVSGLPGSGDTGGAPQQHYVHIQHRYCSSYMPLVPTVCHDLESKLTLWDSVDKTGSRCEARGEWSTRCAAWRAAGGACSGALLAHADQLLHAAAAILLTSR